MAVKLMLHPRNQHREGYDFECLIVKSPELEAFLTRNPRGQMTINFQDVDAVRLLNRALLMTHYGIDFWDIPASYLCPPIPGRVDYIKYLADMHSESNYDKIPRG
ncbi:MAG: RlmF-related methyltransferase, partial [Paracoccaceae bacterium]